MSDTKIQTGVGSLAVRVRGDRPAAVLWHSLFIDQAALLLSGTMDVVERTEHLLAIVLPDLAAPSPAEVRHTKGTH